MKAFSVFLRWDFFTNLQKSVMITVIRRLAAFRKSKFAGNQGTDTSASGGSPPVVGALGGVLQKAKARAKKRRLLLSGGRRTRRRTAKGKGTSKKGEISQMKGYHKRRVIVIRVVAALLALLMIASVFSALIFK